MSDFEAKAPINASADEVVKLMATAEYAEAQAFVDGAVSAKGRLEKGAGDNVVTIVERNDPSREPGKHGKTEKVTVTNNWDVATRRNNWKTVVHGREKLVKIHGVMWIEPTGDSTCNLCEKGHVEINIPLIGKPIANGLAADLKKVLPRKAKLVEKKLAEGKG